MEDGPYDGTARSKGSSSSSDSTYLEKPSFAELPPVAAFERERLPNPIGTAHTLGADMPIVDQEEERLQELYCLVLKTCGLHPVYSAPD